MDNSQPGVRFTWNTHWGCNYRCSYCFFAGRWDEYAPRNVYKPADFWVERWDAMAQKYGRCYIVINGGEPFTYPGFADIVLRISRRHWPINITTNASKDLAAFAGLADPAKISLSLSFHPEYHDLEKFIAVLDEVRKKGFDGCNNIVAYPPFLKDLPAQLRRFESAGHPVKINPFIGEYQGRRYPDGFTPEEKKLLGMTETWEEAKKRKHTLCAAGHCSALILPDGGVTRCGQVGDGGIFGNFFDPAFSLLPDMAPCANEFCPCEEWKTIPDGKAEGSAPYIA
ncbi:MAG: radical SAM protein [Elusimicrobiales bacterium]|nr:radical SAM protein [Elusimicrobiales bacterium]